jgi:very-short-patch-repair endonuclease
MVSCMGIPDAVNDLLAEQHGLATRRQLIGLGHAPAEVDGWRRRRLLVRDYRAVLRQPGAPRTPQQRLMAAILRAGEGACADGLATCWLLGLEGFEPAIGVLVPFPRQVTGAPIPIRSTCLEPADLSTRAGIPCLSAVRAVIEIAPFVTEKALRVAIDSARRSGLLTIHHLERRALDLQTLLGGRIVLAVIGSRAMEQESEGERVLARFLRGIEGLEWGVDDVVPGRRLDCYVRDALLVIEYDSRDHHVLPTDRDNDGLRDIEVRSVRVDGIPLEVVRITKGMVDREPEKVRAFVEQRIAERSAEVAARRAAAGQPA